MSVSGFLFPADGLSVFNLKPMRKAGCGRAGHSGKGTLAGWPVANGHPWKYIYTSAIAQII